jgi:hypothetical protein
LSGGNLVTFVIVNRQADGSHRENRFPEATKTTGYLQHQFFQKRRIRKRNGCGMNSFANTAHFGEGGKFFVEYQDMFGSDSAALVQLVHLSE